jgi:hypothetical protein
MPDNNAQGSSLGVLGCLSAALESGQEGPALLPLGLASGVAVVWWLNAPSQGRLVADVPSPRTLDAPTLLHLAAIAMPAVLRFPGVVVPDPRRQSLKFVIAGLEPRVDVVMPALESLLNQCDVVISLLIDGRLRPRGLV